MSNHTAASDPIISIIIPCYNSENFIDELLASIINQTFEDFEVIVVNDGSTDGTKKRVENWLRTDNRVKYFEQQNKGLCESHNAGAQIAKGKFICSIGHDDILHPQYLERLYNALQQTKADVVFCHHRDFIDGDKVEILPLSPTSEATFYTREEMLDKINDTNIFNYVVIWNKIFPAEIFKNTPFPAGKFFDDEHNTYRLIEKCKTIAEIPDQLYYYRRRKDSMTNSKYTDAKFLDATSAFNDRIKFYRSKQFPEHIVLKRKWHYVWQIWLREQNYAAKKEILMHPVEFIRYAPMRKKLALKNYVKMLK